MSRSCRRAFLSGLAALAASGAMVSTSHRAQAQQPTSVRRVGVLFAAIPRESKEAQAFHHGLLGAGYVEGQDLLVEWQFANGDYARIPALVADLIQRKVDVIVVDSTVAAREAKQATSSIPIVITLIADPIGSGLVLNLAHPGGNVTGLSLMHAELTTKRLQLLKEAIPRLTRVAVLWNPDSPYHPKAIEELKAAAPALSIKPSFVAARTIGEIDPAFSAMTRMHAEALYVFADSFFRTQRMMLLKLASKLRLPATYAARIFVDAGGLMSYGANIENQMGRAAVYVDKILKGAKPGDLPIEQPSKFEFVVNLKAAKALGITIPESILLRADEVIR